jgi:hypothetical protein
MTSASTEQFINRWQDSGASERANYQLFLSELCDVLDVPRPQPAKPNNEENAYVFERVVTFPHGRKGFIDLYKRGCFVLEAKQTRRLQGTVAQHTEGTHSVMQGARNQAEALYLYSDVGASPSRSTRT